MSETADLRPGETDSGPSSPAAGDRVPRQGWGFFHIALVAVVLLAITLRLWSIDFGLPMVTHPDESPILTPAERMVSEGHLNPEWFRYPGLIIYLQAAVILLVNGIDSIVGLSNEHLVSWYFIGGRLVVALFGVATVLLVGLLGRRLVPKYGAMVGILASLSLAVSQLHVHESLYLNPNAPTAFFAALALWFSLDAVEDRSHRSWALAGVAVGLTAASKYNGALVAIVPATALLFVAYPPRTWRSAAGVKILGIAAQMSVLAVIAFLLFNPYAVITPHEFLSSEDGIVAEIEHYREGHEGAEGDDTWRWYLGELWCTGFGPTIFPVIVIGILLTLFQWRTTSLSLLPMLTFVLAYYVLISGYPVRFARQLLPILPFLVLLGAWWLPRVVDMLGPRWRVQHLAVGLTALVIFLVPTIQSAELVRDLGRTDSRYPALEWSRQELPTDSMIAHENYTPPLGDAGFRAILVWSAFDQPAHWYTANSIDYIMVSSYVYQRYLDQPDRYPEQAEFYEDLLAQDPIVGFGSGGRHGGPEIFVYNTDDVLELFASQDPE